MKNPHLEMEMIGISYLVKELLSCCIRLNGKLQFSIHCGDSYTNLWKGTQWKNDYKDYNTWHDEQKIEAAEPEICFLCLLCQELAPTIPTVQLNHQQ